MKGTKIFVLALLCAFAALGAVSELKDEAGKVVIKYVVETPDGMAAAGTKDPAKQLGLILCFPEHDRPVGDEILPVREALQRLGVRDEYVLLAGGPQERKFGAADHEPIAKLIGWAKKTYPINPRRIYMYGKGEGGKISGEFAMLHPDLVTAGITYSWGWWTMPSELKEAIDPLGSAPEFYMVLGLRDLSYHITTVRDAYSRVTAKGYHVIYREFEDLGARTYHPASNEDALAWATKLRNKNVAPSAEEMQLLKRPAVVNGYFPDLALVGGVAAGTVVEKLLGSDKTDVRAAAAETCARGIFSEATLSALAKATQDSSAKVRRAAIHALAVQANWRSEVAQRALIAVARGQAVDEADRVNAADGIVQAARLQLRGVRQDPELFAALVALLADKNEELRTMANNTLAPIRDSGFRGDLGRPERKEPSGGWDAWLREVSAKAAGYQKDYEVCAPAAPEKAAAYCAGGGYLLGRNLANGQPMKKDPVLAFQNTLKAAEQGYVPAEAAVGMMYAIGKGVEQNYAEAAKWWTKAAEAGHILAATNASMVYRGVPGVRADAAKSEQWAKFVAEHSGSQ
jgi:FOG: TPR repeat, SEL1 subfamily